jgi:hypothetical protein
MVRMKAAAGLGFAAALGIAAQAAARPVLDLGRYADADGAISVQHAGHTIDPYFALQALVLAHESGLDIRTHARPWARWLLARQKPDATFDRFCRRGPVWGPCKTADADDALLALWMRFLDLPGNVDPRDPAWDRSRAASAATLARLFERRRGIYLVSPVFQHGLFIDNLEVWHATRRPSALATSIYRAFWSPAAGRFLVSTQAEQAHAAPRFYPDAVAQIFPIVVNFPELPGAARDYYAAWMRRHRGEWLAQVRADFAWGLIALAAWRQGDRVSAGCWLREVAPHRHGDHWTVTDEAVLQVLQARGARPAAATVACT